jgi:hypothetical protein
MSLVVDEKSRWSINCEALVHHMMPSCVDASVATISRCDKQLTAQSSSDSSPESSAVVNWQQPA